MTPPNPNAGEESRLFDALCELEPEAQEARLRALACDDPMLAQRLRRLLAIDARYAEHTVRAVGDVLAEAVAAHADTHPGTTPDADPNVDPRPDAGSHRRANEDRRDAVDASGANDGIGGTEAGAFRLLRRIGRGGMGVVYLAERRSGFAQQVAIKLLPRFASDAATRARFAHERRLLAQLRHPHVCSILDGGELDDGTPWLAMELVRGESLCAWCARQALPLRERVTLFLQLCEAVQYAHRQLIVHRDIKDGNVLVDEHGHARLLDFGIAKALGGDDAETTDVDGGAHHTLAEERFFSPLSASPEQLRGERSTTAVDLYALGALLHQLLTGLLPFADAARDRVALQRAILERVAPPMSAALQRALEQSRVPASHPVAPRALRGDLDAIVARCLRKHPDERYAEVADLARDLRDWLAGHPVSVAGGDRMYRLRKFVARNRSATALGALAALSLMLALGATLWRSAELRVERDAARAARERSELDRDRARAAADFLRETFEQADPTRASAGGLMARDLIAQGVRRLDRLHGQPDVQAELALLLAESQQAMGLDTDSRALLRDHAPQLQALARADAGSGWRLRRAHAATAVALDADPATTVAAIDALARQARTPEQHVDVARLRERLAVRQSQFGRAAGHLQTAWQTHADGLSADARLALRVDLAWAMISDDREREARRLLEAVDRADLARRLPAVQIRYWRTLARALGKSARADARDRDALRDAVAQWQRAAIDLYGPESLETASAYIWTIEHEPDPATQQRLLERAYAIQNTRLPPDTLARAIAEHNAGEFWRDLRKDPMRAEPYLARAVASGRAAAGRAHSDVRRFEVRWAVALNALGRHAQVLDALSAPPDVDDARDARNHSRLRLALADAAAASGQAARAEREREAVRALWRRLGEPPPDDVARALSGAAPDR